MISIKSYLRRNIQAKLPTSQIHFSSNPHLNMPLVDPITNSAAGGDDKNQQWLNKLAGKKIGEVSNETTFAKQDLPEEHRIIEPGSMVTKDFKENRLNIHLNEDGTVSHVNHQ
ncbi:04d6f175-161f-4d08-847d-a3da1fb9a8fb [Sclerotinia trifoliorum]|uniref:04d6f175-161f-4d08-847d-a3da1fb9a8fb n=1 Tax=Sclerotinia trifoliorum TaxID=28548 RepID=A0A8H2ZUD2_9HELO|nr:04d6f175-161f-4d08-847d-a3da1fb9a8fb [Sclerotinia trifoliorum]